jgi:hypothetical protein
MQAAFEETPWIAVVATPLEALVAVAAVKPG